MHPCLSLSASQNHRHSIYASATACTLPLSSQTASQCCAVPLPIHWHQLISFLCYTVYVNRRARSRGPEESGSRAGAKDHAGGLGRSRSRGATCVGVESRGVWSRSSGEERLPIEVWSRDLLPRWLCLAACLVLRTLSLHSTLLLSAAVANAPVRHWLESPSGGTMLLSTHGCDESASRHSPRWHWRSAAADAPCSSCC
jgi:hypothetical protein